ncbi:MAG: 1,4-alpha-glucan branching protein GlgB [Eubacteriales bacterium]|nr:1,4-alpha-glucan branching protein GlgB [Eubacteriales bacterium]
MDMYGFYTGKIFDAYEFLGCHLTPSGAVFRTFAPAASGISVIGEFNGWTEMPMHKINDGNFWECEIGGVKEGMLYKYKIYGRNGSVVDHCDPYGYGMELRPNSASVVRNLYQYQFHDEKWMKKRTDCMDKPLNIYELHLGSWRTDKDSENGWYTYTGIADELIAYVKEMGYNYIEMMPISEHPSDNSWGYQNTGFYSPTSRYGTADGLKELIDRLHQNEIGVILDFVPVHFAVDAYALANYDGTALYEYPHQDVGVSEWGSKNFNHSRGEIQSFLQSNANYWLKEYHFDGLRMDAINNIIYWQGNRARGVNSNAVEFIRYMNQGLKRMYPAVILAAEDSSAFPGVTKPAEQGGLGFTYKWDMGWMNDTLDYFKKTPEERTENYHKLTFSMMYYYDDHFLLPFSHDEVVHGKATIAQKMYGDYDGKFPQARALYMYMYAHPGKKLNFMGNEFAQLREWDEKREQDWDILKYPKHNAFHRFMKDLNKLYLSTPAMSAKDYGQDGFRWLDCHQESKCIYAFERTDGQQRLIALFNFSGVLQEEFRLQVGDRRRLKLLLASDAQEYDGSVEYKKDTSIPVKKGVASINIGAFTAMYFLAE